MTSLHVGSANYYNNIYYMGSCCRVQEHNIQVQVQAIEQVRRIATSAIPITDATNWNLA